MSAREDVIAHAKACRGAIKDGVSRPVYAGADLTGANLSVATLPDGRTLLQWQQDPLAGLCTSPDAVDRAVSAWGNHSWQDCPLHEGMGISGINEAPVDKRILAATFVSLFDGRHLPKPTKEIS